ncbi:hypothetical protein V8J38_09100 [Brevundimonas olei]|uniref:Uncharacterized protein n=1 Tax=Brevundimonas olei TaxID=657642 RepID=A0ABZ2I869_9CAUL
MMLVAGLLIDQPVGDPPDAGRRGGGSRLAGPHDVEDLGPVSEQIVSDDPTVTSPPERFRTHDGAGSSSTQLEQFDKAEPERSRQA